jgi:hypothetical protein
MTTTQTTPISVQDKVRNYQGQNRFLLNMKDSLKKWGGLTPKQLEATEKALNSEVKTVNMENLPEDIKRIVEYKGENPFVKDIASKFAQWGTLTSKQISAAVAQIQKEEDKEKTVRMNWPTVGETIKLGRRKGMELKETYGLKFNPILIDITSLKAVSPKAVQFTGKLTIKRGDVCTCCMKTLTDEFSMLTGMGKTCAKHVGIEYIKDASEAKKFREEYLKRVDEIGEMEFWVPKTQIKKWDGVTASIVGTI